MNDLDVILHGVMQQIIYTTDFRVKRLNNLTLRLTRNLTLKFSVKVFICMLII